MASLEPTTCLPELPKPVAFTEIKYSGKTQINYLEDFTALNPNHVAYLEGLKYSENQQKKQRGAFDTIADELYKKILKQGYIEKPSKVIKKKGKGDSDVNYYNLNDNFLNDDQCCIQKKDKFSEFKDYKCVCSSLQELYDSQLYKNKVNELIIDVNKRKAPDQFNPTEEQDFQKFDEIKKKIKESIKGMMMSKTAPENKPIIDIIQIQDNSQNPPNQTVKE